MTMKVCTASSWACTNTKILKNRKFNKIARVKYLKTLSHFSCITDSLIISYFKRKTYHTECCVGKPPQKWGPFGKIWALWWHPPDGSLWYQQQVQPCRRESEGGGGMAPTDLCWPPLNLSAAKAATSQVTRTSALSPPWAERSWCTPICSRSCTSLSSPI